MKWTESNVDYCIRDWLKIPSNTDMQMNEVNWIQCGLLYPPLMKDTFFREREQCISLETDDLSPQDLHLQVLQSDNSEVFARE